MQAIVIKEVAAHNIKKMNELLTYQELAIWRRENGFDRVVEGEESCFYVHRSLPPTPEQYYAGLWSEVNALKEAISMSARTPWQKTMQFVDGLQGRLPDEELAAIKRYVERRSRKKAQEQTTVTPVATVQHCSPISQTPEPPSGVHFNLENEEKIELDELKSSSADTGLETPGQQRPPIEGIWETGKTTASSILTAGASPSRGENISSPVEREKSTTTVADISSKAATPSKQNHKPRSEQNKQFDPGGREEKAPPWNAAVLYFFFFSGESGEAPCLCFVLCTCEPVLPNY